MGRLWHLARKDLLRQTRSPLAVSFVLSFPIVFALLLALAFGSGSRPRIPKVELLIEDRADDLLSHALVAAFASAQAATYFDARTVGAEGSELMERGKAAALLRIPAGFASDLLAGRPLTLELVRNPAQGILPEIAEQTMTVLAEGLDAASRMLRGPLGELSTMIDEDAASGPGPERVAALATAAYGAVNESEGLLLPPAITLETVQLEGAGRSSGGASGSAIFLMVLPGISVWALFMLGDMAMRDVLAESQKHTLQRQLSAPLTAGQVVLGKALYTALLAGISLVILSAIGAFAADRAVDLPGFVLLSLALVLSVTGWAALVYGIARTERQGATVSSAVFLVFAFIGGSFVQIDQLPEAMRRFAPLSPFYWGTTGYAELIRDGAGLADVLPQIGVLAGLGAVLLAAGGTLLGRRVLRGGAA